MKSKHEKVVRNKLGLLRLAEELGNVSRACKVMGYSRDTFYRYKQAVEEGGVEALLEESRRGKANIRNRTAPEIEEAIVQMATELPAYGQERVSNELRRRGHTISPTGVRSVWLRHNLETRKKRLTALEKKVAEEGIVLTEAQVAALETQRRDDRSPWRNRNALSRISWVARHVLRGHPQGSWPHLSANVCRHVFEGCGREVVYEQNGAHIGGRVERPGASPL